MIESFPVIFSTQRVLYDSFDRANSTTAIGTADTGQVWTTLAGTMGISSNEAYPQALVTSRAIAVLESGKSDVMVSSEITWRNSEHLVFRCTDVSNMLVAAITSTGLLLIRYQADVGTTLQTYAFTPVAGTKYLLTVYASANNISVYLDSVLRINLGSTFNQTATKHGFRCFNSPTTARFNNFKVDSL